MLNTGALVLLALSPFAIDHALCTGEWAGASDADPKGNHVYLRLEDSDSGRFAFVAGGKTIVDFEFEGGDLSKPEGYLELTKSFGDWGAKVVLSGWVSAEDGGAGLLTGTLYMFQRRDDRAMVFNSFPLTMSAVAGPLLPGNPPGTDVLTEISKTYNSD